MSFSLVIRKLDGSREQVFSAFTDFMRTQGVVRSFLNVKFDEKLCRELAQLESRVKTQYMNAYKAKSNFDPIRISEQSSGLKTFP